MTAGSTLVYGVAITGEATARALVARGHDVVLADDADNPRARALADELGVELVEAPDAATVADVGAIGRDGRAGSRGARDPSGHHGGR